MTLAPRFRRCSKRRAALWGRKRTSSDRLDLPRACATYPAHPNRSTACAVDAANLPRVLSAWEIWLASRWRRSVTFAPCQGGALSSQADSALAPDGALAESAWPTRHVLPPAAGGGAAKCSRQYVKRRVRSAAEVKGVWVTRLPQFGKHPPRIHHATQNSWPASFCGGGRVRNSWRVPPRRVTMLVKSASGAGLSIRTTLSRVGSVMDDTPVDADVALLLPPAEMTLGAFRVVVLGAAMWRMGSKYASGSGTQLLDCWKVPRRNSVTRVRNSKRSTPSWLSATLVSTL